MRQTLLRLTLPYPHFPLPPPSTAWPHEPVLSSENSTGSRWEASMKVLLFWYKYCLFPHLYFSSWLWILSAVVATCNCKRKARETHRHQLWSLGAPESLWAAAYSQLTVMKKNSLFVSATEVGFSATFSQENSSLLHYSSKCYTELCYI